MLKRSLTTITLTLILFLTFAIVSAGGKEGAGCHGLENALASMPEQAKGRAAVLAQYESRCQPTTPPPTTPPPTEPTPTEPTPTEPTPTEPTPTEPPSNLDSDFDGFFNSIDCAPTDPNVYPGSPSGSCDNVNQQVFGTGELQITLAWDNVSNLDLEIVEPSGEMIWEGNLDSGSGGFHDGDSMATCGDTIGAENVYWADADVGNYIIRVSEDGNCGNAYGNWILTIRVNGSIVYQQSGTGASGDIPYSHPV